jgi:uncharacterized membrane protein
MSGRPAKVAAIAHAGACVSLLALVFLCLAWELWLSPLRPGGSWVVLKVLPLLAALTGVLRGRRYTMQWASMMILAYFTEGTVRAWSESGLARGLAVGEIALSLLFFACTLAFARAMRGSAPAK